MDWQQHIERVPGVMLGKPIFRGMQITVEFVLERLEHGATPEDLILSHPPLTVDDVKAARTYSLWVEANLGLQSAEGDRYGELNPNMICPHCETKGRIRTKSVRRKAGISDTKVLAAVLTQGVSLLATGLSGTEERTSARCGECGNVWDL